MGLPCLKIVCHKSVDRTFLKSMFVLFLVTFLVVLPVVCLRMRYSLYHHIWKKKAQQFKQEDMRQENNKRLNLANEFLVQYQQKQGIRDERTAVDVGITIITVSRNRLRLSAYEPKYLTQVVSSFLKQMNATQDLKFKYELYLCNVDLQPSTYYELKSLTKFVKTFQMYNTTPQSDEESTYSLSLSEKLEKEKRDYVFCGEKTLGQNVSYVFLVEDDALPHPDLFPVLEKVVKFNVMGSNSEIKIPKRNITYIKFYHPDRLLSYISIEYERLPELFSLSAIISVILTLAYQKIRPVSVSYSRPLWFYMFLFSCLVVLVIGRQSLLDLRRMSKYLYQVTPAPSCCTQANLYPRQGMMEVIQYLKGVRCHEKFGKDIALEKFKTQQKKIALMVQPNLFTHIGMYSSLRDVILNPRKHSQAVSSVISFTQKVMRDISRN